MHAVEAEGLTKRFGETRALRGVDLTVAEGSVCGLLGPNGAGKTTTVRILTTLLRPDAGRAFVDGVDVVTEPARVRSRIGLTGQYAAVEERLTGRENLELVARYFHLPRAEGRARSHQLLERFDLVHAAERIVKGYSGGMRRRLDIAMSLISRPAVLFLDEPTTGLDPRSRLAMWDLIAELGDEGTTTLLTTQYLEEADRLADNIVVIDNGTVIAEGTADDLKDRIGGSRLVVTIARRENLARTAGLLASMAAGPVDTDEHLATVTAPVRQARGAVPDALRALEQAGVEVVDLEVHRPTLDDVFLTLTGHTAQGDESQPGTTTHGAPR